MVITDKEKQRFYSKVLIIPSGCWDWQGCIDSGYGKMRIGNKILLAHHISFYIHNQKDPSRYIMHSCNNRKCVNPKHLYESNRNVE